MPTKKRSRRGFSLLETMMAVGIMALAMIGSLAMVTLGVGRNGSTQADTTAANVAQTVLEEIASVPPNVNPPPILNMTDCAGNNVAITTAPGGAALVPNPPPLPGFNPGDIDFTVPAVAGYQISYAMCAPNGRQIDYLVRWNIQNVVDGTGKTWGKLVTVATRNPANFNNGDWYSRPVTLRTVVGM